MIEFFTHFATALASLLFAVFPVQMQTVGGGSGTIEQLSPWTQTATTVRLSSTTAKLRIPSLPGCDTIDTDAIGVMTCGTDSGGGSSSFSTTSTDYWQTQRSFFSTTSENYYQSVNNFFSTTSAQYLLSVSSLFSTTSADYLQTLRNYFSTTSANYFLSQNTTNAFATTSAIFFVDASTTIPKTYKSNTYATAAIQTIPYASTTGLTAGSLFLSGTTLASASTITIDAGASSLSVRGGGGNFAILDTSLVSPAHTYTFPNSAGTFCLVGTACDGGTFAWTPVPTFGATAANSTSTLIGFTNGLYALASSTIGSGSEGLYINGSATTTGTASSTYLFASKSGTSTSFAANNFYINPITSALALIGADHKASAYGGAAACSANNFVTTISAVGGTTCGTAAISGKNLGSNLDALTATNASLTFSGSYDGSAARTVGLNLGNENIWTASSTFPGLNIGQSTTTMATTTYLNSTFILSSTANFTAATSTWLAAKFASSTAGWFQKLNIATTSCPMMLCVGATSSYGSIIVAENTISSTSTIGKTIDWKKGNQQVYQMGASAVALGFNNASSSGQTLRLVVCNGADTAGALTFTQVGSILLWSAGTAPTQTTTANKCDVYSFLVTSATSSLAAPGQVIFGNGSVNF